MSDNHRLPPESPYAFLSPAEARAWFAYMRLQLRLRYEMNRQLRADSGISLADYDVLVALTSEPDGRMQISALATRIGWERSRTSHHVKRLETRGMLTLTRSAHDKRAVDVTLSAQGWQKLREASPQHIELVRSMFFDGLGSDALENLTSALEDIYETVIERGTLPRPVDHP
ncbi:transcriptional regulator, MarR family [Kribbella flavida DSM 17836]|uniref:Transcriptional regulator, MarR family n=1 Tax=Kribbella flavida (strain DSM 17836 / JCM 10339 / NBRC 14399) TaxID=479435 RepID=D2Q2Q2_KRIFD|nr:MarR family winged helix-turn-helix transcriptional regulator [Kribbella flavida]ADB30233.1 transcriptional regulator, MarR family [Kribbella flavida DSM 17836]